MTLYPIVKRYLDIVLAALGIIVLSPLFLLIAILIRCDSKGPIIFKQKRVGRYKKEFMIFKFRTMSTQTPNDLPTHLLENSGTYITRTGKILRKLSLDELPQLFNIIKGEMSIIGPRPALWNQYDLIEARERHNAYDVYPGLTGWAQVNGRDELSINIKSQLDGYYANNISFVFDIRIFLLTILKVVIAKGVVEGRTDIQQLKK